MTTPEPCHALYVHVPFCRRICGYCDFYRQVLNPDLTRAYTDAVIQELDGYLQFHSCEFDTVYLGGGTPTVLPPADLERLLQRISAAPLARDSLEFTVEANPATVTDVVADILAGASVNRISLGAQSFDAAELRVLDRQHEPEHVEQTITTLRAVGITNISLDLIFGIPGQSLVSLRRSLDATLALRPQHVSCYGLMYEPGTPLHAARESGAATEVDEELEAEMYELVRSTLATAGLPQYEISNYARQGYEARHNLHYWRNEPYVGVGPAAAGYLDGVRYKNVADTRTYIEAVRAGRPPRDEEETLEHAERMRETAMLALRLTAGVNRREFEERFAVDPAEHFHMEIERHVSAGLLEVTPAAIRLTPAGFLLADRVMRDFV